MNAVEYINENLDVMKLLNYYNFREITESEDQIRACCEIHKGNNPTGLRPFLSTFPLLNALADAIKLNVFINV